MRRTQIEVYERHSDGLFDWRILSNNGQIVGTSGGQGYSSRYNAHRGLKTTLTLLGADRDMIEIIDVPAFNRELVS